MSDDKVSWQVTHEYTGTEEERKDAFKEFGKSKTGVHFVFGGTLRKNIVQPASLTKKTQRGKK